MENHLNSTKGVDVFQVFKSGGYAQFVRYIVVGFVQNSLGYILYLLITWAGLDPKVTISILYPVGFVMSYVGNKRWTFSHIGDNTGSTIRFTVTHLIGYSFNLIVLYVSVDVYDYNHQYVQLLAMFILIFYYFFALRMYVFKHDPSLDCE